jgi:hypothetical protein
MLILPPSSGVANAMPVASVPGTNATPSAALALALRPPFLVPHLLIWNGPLRDK